MDASDRVAARYLGLPIPTAHKKVAAFPPMPPKNDSSPAARNIPKGHPFDKRALKPLSKALWASTVALGHALTAYRHLSRLKSTTVSPDGNLGGRGYVMSLGTMRQKLYEASEALSSISDTIYDEITGPHWQPQLAQLDENDREDVSRFVEESQSIMENPEGDAEEAIEKIEGENDGDTPEKSSLPTADDAQAEPEPRSLRNKEASATPGLKRIAGMSDRQWASYCDTHQALFSASSIPVHDLGGPRVDHIGPGAGDGLYGDFNPPEDTLPGDSWSADGGGMSRRDDSGEDYDYTSEWENAASSTTPVDSTPTDAWDFGIGYGAHGDGAGGYANPSGEGAGNKGVFGPQSGLPGAPSHSPGDSTGDTRHLAEVAQFLYGAGLLPQDVVKPPARSDYYPGPKDNMISPMSTSDVPGPGDTHVSDPGDPDLLNTYLTVEDVSTPYVRYDYTTHTLRDLGDHPGQNHQEPWALDGDSTR